MERLQGGGSHLNPAFATDRKTSGLVGGAIDLSTSALIDNSQK